jgi:threonine aldolase
MKNNRSFASDNNAPVHKDVIKAIIEANEGDVIAYGDDIFTSDAERKFRHHFQSDVKVFFVFNGTGANVSAISHLTSSFHGIIAAESAHLNNDECGAPEKFSGCKILPVSTPDGKITVEMLGKFLHSKGFEHHSQPKVISISQPTELGTLYRPEEILKLAHFADEHDMLLHVDGARIANAVAALNVSLADIITYTGVDVISFGGTKNGMMYGEAVVFISNILASDFQYVRKQSMQLASKMRYISAQFNAMFYDDLWLKNARHANKMAKLLELKLRDIPQIKITQLVETNAIFAIIPPEIIEPLQEEYFFYVWNEEKNEVRWMTHYNTTAEDVDNFVLVLKKLLKI